MAWLCALRGRVLGYVLLGSLAVLTKESSYFLCLPTTVLWWARLVKVEHRRPFAPGTLIRVFPAGLPGVTLALWLVVHQKITGHVMSSDHTVLLGSLGSTAGAQPATTNGAESACGDADDDDATGDEGGALGTPLAARWLSRRRSRRRRNLR